MIKPDDILFYFILQQDLWADAYSIDLDFCPVNAIIGDIEQKCSYEIVSFVVGVEKCTIMMDRSVLNP